MDFEELVRLHPRIHLDEKGDPISWAIGDDVLRYLDRVLEPGWTTVETGTGMSTLVFLVNGCRHTAISPAAREFDVIRAFCREHLIDTAEFNARADRSEQVLPVLGVTDIDLFLIDGRHAFPSPYVDFYYGAERLRTGGLMVVDDTHLLTGTVLRDFLVEDTHWRTVELFDKTAVFEKLDDRVHVGEWNTQPYILSRM